MIKFLERSGIQGKYLNVIEAVDSKLIANIKLNGENLKDKVALSPYLFHVVLEVLVKAIRQKMIKGINTGKEKVKLPLFADDMIEYINDLKMNSYSS